MNTLLTEGNHLSEYLVWEMENMQSRELVTVAGGQALKMGQVLGKIKAGAVPTTGTAGTNTGGGTLTLVSGGAKVKAGVYTLLCTLVVAGGGIFTVTDPDGLSLPDAAMGAYTHEQINFTLTDGTPDFALGDSFTITIPAGSGLVSALDLAAVNGAADAFGILIDDIDTTESTERSVAYTGGGVLPFTKGMVLTGATSGATAQVKDFTLTSGTWAGGDAAGVLYLENQVGTFQSENLNAVIQDNIATIGANSAAYYPDRRAVVVVRDAQVIGDNLIWPTGFSVAQIAAGMAALYDKGIVSRDQA